VDPYVEFEQGGRPDDRLGVVSQLGDAATLDGIGERLAVMSSTAASCGSGKTYTASMFSLVGL
jgi:hypothetical protein